VTGQFPEKRQKSESEAITIPLALGLSPKVLLLPKITMLIEGSFREVTYHIFQETKTGKQEFEMKGSGTQGFQLNLCSLLTPVG